jgi:hypothetical protein
VGGSPGFGGALAPMAMFVALRRRRARDRKQRYRS